MTVTNSDANRRMPRAAPESNAGVKARPTRPTPRTAVMKAPRTLMAGVFSTLS